MVLALSNRASTATCDGILELLICAVEISLRQLYALTTQVLSTLLFHQDFLVAVLLFVGVLLPWKGP